MKNLIAIMLSCGFLTACLGGGSSSGGFEVGGSGLGGPTPTTTTMQPSAGGGGISVSAPVVTTTTLPSRATILANVRADLNSQPGGNGLWATLKSEATGRSNFAVLQGPDGKAYAIDITKWVKGQSIQDMINAGVAIPNLSSYKETKNEYRYQGSTSVSKTGWACPSTSYCSKSYPEQRKVYSWKDTLGNYSTGEICPYGSYSSQCTSTTIDGPAYYAWTETNSIYGYQDVTYTYFKDPVTGIVFEEGDYTSKDLESIGAALNDETIATVRNGLVSQFGLSESRAGELASMANSMSSILKNQGRALTERDLQALQVKAMGFTVKDFVTARRAGDKKQLTELAERAAKINKISLEQSKRLLNQMAQ